MAIHVVSAKWFGKGKKPNHIYIGRPSILGNPISTKPSKYTIRTVATNKEAVEEYHHWLRAQWNHDGPVKEELLRLARLYKEQGTLYLVCWCKKKINDDIPCHGDVLRDAIEGIIAKGLV